MLSELRHHTPRGLLCPFSALVCGYGILNICAAQPSPVLHSSVPFGGSSKVSGPWTSSACSLVLFPRSPGVWPQSIKPGTQTPRIKKHPCLVMSASLTGEAPPSRLCAPFHPLPSSSPPSNAHRSPVELFLHTCPREMETCPHTDWHTNIHSIWSHKCPKLEPIHVPTT